MNCHAQIGTFWNFYTNKKQAGHLLNKPKNFNKLVTGAGRLLRCRFTVFFFPGSKKQTKPGFSRAKVFKSFVRPSP
jgi:hypothetical protein